MENFDGDNKNVPLSLIAEYGASDSESDGAGTPSFEHVGNSESEDGVELSEMVLKNNIINACAHGPLTKPERDDEEVTSHMIIDGSESGVVEYEVTEYREADSSDSESSSSSDSSDSDVESVKDVEEVSSGDEDGTGRPGKLETPKVQGELGLDDLPPIEDLAISLPPHDCTKIGTIFSIVDRLVIVRALPDTPAVDLDSVLFLEQGARALGKVFDVFGPVTEPHYCVRFNSQEHVKEKQIETGADVFIAPRSPHTTYVFLSELMKLKGSDASWLNDTEPPPSHVEFSDDEEERRVKKQNKQSKLDPASSTSSDQDRGQRRMVEAKRNHRPIDSNSRFGSGPSRGRNPFAGNFRRPPQHIFPQYHNPRYNRPWPPGPQTPCPPFPGPPLPYQMNPIMTPRPYFAPPWFGDNPPPPGT